MGPAQGFLGGVALHALRAQVNEHHMRVGATGDDIETALDQLISERLRVLDDLFLIAFEFGAECLAKCDRFACNHMHQRTALNAGEDGGVAFLCNRFIVRQDHTAPWATQCLVCCGGRDMRMREGRGVKTRCHKSGKVRHIDEQVGADTIRDLAHFCEVNDARNGRSTGDDHFGLMFGGKALDLVIIKQAILLAHAVLDRVEPFARLVWLGPVGQVAACIEGHAKDRITRLQEGLEHALVCL